MASKIIQQIQEQKVNFIDFWFVDIFGELHKMGMPSYSLKDNDFEYGLEKLDASSIIGFEEVNKSDLLLKPDPLTFRILPPDYDDSNRKTARIFCDIYQGDANDESVYSRDSRGIISKSKKELTKLGYAYSMWVQKLNFLFLIQLRYIHHHMLQHIPTVVQDIQ